MRDVFYLWYNSIILLSPFGLNIFSLYTSVERICSGNPILHMFTYGAYIPAWIPYVLCRPKCVVVPQGSNAGPGQRADQQDGGAGQGRMWKKKHQEARVRREYRTADEVVRETSELCPEAVLAAQPILDMRGPQVRLVTNLAHLNVKVRRSMRINSI